MKDIVEEKTCETCGKHYDCVYSFGRWTCYNMERWEPIEKKYCPHCNVELDEEDLEELRRR